MKEFLKAGTQLGYEVTDPNSPRVVGYSPIQATMRNGRRCSAAKAFIKPFLDRPNLKVSLRSRVTKILIDPETKVAYGVEFLKGRRKFQVRVSKEVILSAGSFNSPHLLMLSGVGPSEVLDRAGIPILSDLKVGYNLQDHFAFSGLIFLVNSSVTVSDMGVQNPVHIFNYIFGEKTSPYFLK